MLYRTIFQNGPDLSAVALGTDYYGKLISEESACRLLDTYLELGGNIIDTAHAYSDWLPGERHMSEKVIGRWLKSTKQRDRVLLATKGAFPEIGNYHASRLSRRDIEQDLNESLQCLGVEQIDLYWLHRDHESVPAEQIVEWMNDFIRQGKIRYLGVSNWRAERISAANQYAEKQRLCGFSASQVMWSLARPTAGAIQDDTIVMMDHGEYQWYEKKRFPVFAYSSQAKGFFAKLRVEDGNFIKPDGKAGDRYFNEQNCKTYEWLRSLQSRYQAGMNQLALAWLMRTPFVTIPIIGSRTIEQLRDSMAAVQWTGLEELADRRYLSAGDI